MVEEEEGVHEVMVESIEAMFSAFIVKSLGM